MANVNDSLRSTEAKLDAQLDKARRSQKTTLIGGIIIIAIILAYFTVISQVVTPMAEPDNLSEFLIEKAKPQVSELGPAADKFVKEEAPQMIKKIINDAITVKIPEGRQALQAHIEERANTALDGLEAEINKSADEAITKYSANIKEFADQLRTDNGTEEVKDHLYKMIDDSIKDEKVMSDLDDYGIALKTLEGHVARLTSTPSATMSEDDQALFHLIAVVRELSSRSALIQMKGVSLKVGNLDTDAAAAAVDNTGSPTTPAASDAKSMAGDAKPAADAKAAEPKMDDKKSDEKKTKKKKK